MRISRRKILLGLAGLTCLARASAGAVQKRRYLVDATVSMLGAPLMTRQNVGTAFVLLHESGEADRRTLRLHFAGGSNPERAHGVVYAGSTEECVVERCSAPQEATYFGFITAPEDEAQPIRRAAFERKNSCSFVAVEGQHESGCAHRKRVCIALPTQAWRDMPDLIEQIRSRFAANTVTYPDLYYPGVPATFLYSTLAAIRSGQSRSSWTYIHNGHSFRLDCEKARETSGNTRLTGHIYDQVSKRASTFRLWLEADSDLPTRIEFQPRSYLRITLEREES